VKRPILGLLAAALLSFGLGGLSPARAATPNSSNRPVVTHHDGDDHDGYKYSHPYHQGGTRHHGDDDYGDDDGHDGHRRRCAGLIVVCLG